MKAMKMQSNAQANNMNAWEYEQEKKKQHKQTKQMRSLRQNRKGMWQAGE